MIVRHCSNAHPIVVEYAGVRQHLGAKMVEISLYRIANSRQNIGKSAEICPDLSYGVQIGTERGLRKGGECEYTTAYCECDQVKVHLPFTFVTDGKQFGRS